MAMPVFKNFAAGTLVKNMWVEESPTYDGRCNVTYLEAVGRSLAGIAPWLALPDDDSSEGVQPARLREFVLQGLASGVDQKNPDYLNFRTDKQPIVDAANLAHGFLRAHSGYAAFAGAAVFRPRELVAPEVLWPSDGGSGLLHFHRQPVYGCAGVFAAGVAGAT
jgi:hypothetical protein